MIVAPSKLLFEGIQLFVDESEHAWRDAAQGIGKGILQGLDGAQPKHSVHAHVNAT